MLSTTLTTNAIAQNKLPPVGMIVSSGPGIDPEALRTNPLFFPVSGSIDHRGREVQPVDVREIQSITATLQAVGVRYVGVVGKFSVRNPQHELLIRDELRERFDQYSWGIKCRVP